MNILLLSIYTIDKLQNARWHTWNIMWLKLSLSRSSGFNNFNVLPLSEKTGSIFWNTSSNEMFVSASPKIGNSGGVVCCATTVEKWRKKKTNNEKSYHEIYANYRWFGKRFANEMSFKRFTTNYCNLVNSSNEVACLFQTNYIMFNDRQ